MSTEMVLARIRPNSPRQLHHFEGRAYTKERGWYEVPKDLGERLAQERLHDINLDSPLLFEVRGIDAAKVVAERERVRVEPAGTPDAPIRFNPTAPAAEAPAPAKKPAAKKPAVGSAS